LLLRGLANAQAELRCGVTTLREWFRRSAGFFADHLKRYSKSRRQARDAGSNHGDSRSGAANRLGGLAY